MKNIIYISDFFASEHQGGAELSDNVVIQFLSKEGYNIKTVKSQTFNPTLHKADIFIISNFVGLSQENKNWFPSSNTKYIIIERDQKYVRSRNTAMYINFIAPKTEVVNQTFYRGAHKVYCLTNHSAEILLSHIDLTNVESFGTTQFSESQFDIIEKNIGKKKNNKFAIVSGKRSNKAIQYCEVNKLEFDILPSMSYEDLIERLSEYKGIAFFSHAVETCCRLLVESRMLELKIVTDNRNGCTYEKWFKEKKGIELLDFLKEKVSISLDKLKGEL